MQFQHRALDDTKLIRVIETMRHSRTQIIRYLEDCFDLSHHQATELERTLRQQADPPSEELNGWMA